MPTDFNVGDMLKRESGPGINLPNPSKRVMSEEDQELAKIVESLKVSIKIFGCRIGELLTLRVKDLEFDDYGMRLTVKEKTGVRKVRVVRNSVPLAL